MRKSFEKYIRENSSYLQKKSNFLGYKKYIIGFILGLFFVGTFSYAAPVMNGGTIGGLFEYFKNKIENGHPKSNIYRLDGKNIEDDTVTSYEIKDGEVKTADIGNLQVTNIKLAPNSVKSGNIEDGEIKTADIGNFQVTKSKLANNSVDSDKIINGSIKGGTTGDIGKDTIANWNIKPDTIGETEIANNFKARTAIRSDYSTLSNLSQTAQYAYNSGNAMTLNGKSVTTDLRNPIPNPTTTIPTTKAVKDYFSSKPIYCYGKNKVLQWDGNRWYCINMGITPNKTLVLGGYKIISMERTYYTEHGAKVLFFDKAHGSANCTYVGYVNGKEVIRDRAQGYSDASLSFSVPKKSFYRVSKIQGTTTACYHDPLKVAEYQYR